MRKSIATILIIVALAVGGAVGWAVTSALHGNQADTAKTTTTQPSTKPSGTTSGSGSNDTSSTATLKCTATSLTAQLAASPGGAAAGNRYYDLTVTNSSSSDCTIAGYPGVSLTDSSGAQIGSPADKDTSKAATTLTLAAGASAIATIHTAVTENYPTGTCKTGATALKIYPPDDTGSLSVPTTLITDWCPGFSTTVFVKS